MRKVVVPDYNDKGQHSSLFELTPAVAYGRKTVDIKNIMEKQWGPIIKE